MLEEIELLIEAPRPDHLDRRIRRARGGRLVRCGRVEGLRDLGHLDSSSRRGSGTSGSHPSLASGELNRFADRTAPTPRITCRSGVSLSASLPSDRTSRADEQEADRLERGASGDQGYDPGRQRIIALPISVPILLARMLFGEQ
jgi:hypothetical protein